MSQQEIINSETKILKDPLDALINEGHNTHFDRLTNEQNEKLGIPIYRRAMEKYHDEPKAILTPQDEDVALEEEDVN